MNKILNEREKAIRDGYEAALKKGYALCLGKSCNWSRGRIVKGGSRTILFPTPDGLDYKGNQQYIEKKFY